MATIRGDDSVFWGNSAFQADTDGFLANSKMAETSNKLVLVKLVSGHFHSTHCLHLAVHVNEAVFGNSDLQ
jgi:hypothetical protein